MTRINLNLSAKMIFADLPEGYRSIDPRLNFEKYFNRAISNFPVSPKRITQRELSIAMKTFNLWELDDREVNLLIGLHHPSKKVDSDIYVKTSFVNDVFHLSNQELLVKYQEFIIEMQLSKLYVVNRKIGPTWKIECFYDFSVMKNTKTSQTFYLLNYEQAEVENIFEYMKKQIAQDIGIIWISTQQVDLPTEDPKKYTIESYMLQSIRNRNCCKLTGRLEEQYCNICGRIVPLEWQVISHRK